MTTSSDATPLRRTGSSTHGQVAASSITPKLYILKMSVTRVNGMKFGPIAAAHHRVYSDSYDEGDDIMNSFAFAGCRAKKKNIYIYI